MYGSAVRKKDVCPHFNSNNKFLNSFEKGVVSESNTVQKLISKGYTILGRRLRTKHGEIDILASRDKDLVAVEVKQRKTLESARSCITMRQMARISNAIMLLASQLGGQFESYRVDVVCFDAAGRSEHIENAFYIGDFVEC
jgi:putative endonuclease